MTAPRTYDTVLALVANDGSLYALRSDGAVFRLLKTGDRVASGRVEAPYWAAVPAIPGTIAALEQQG